MRVAASLSGGEDTMITKTRWVISTCLIIIIFAACGGGGGGSSASTPNLSIKLTDSPGDYLNVFVTITEISAIIEGSDPIPLEFADFRSSAVVEETGDSFTVDLIQLSNGDSIEIALGNLPIGKLNQLRLVVTAASLYAYEDVIGLDGPDPGNDISHDVAEFNIKVPSGVQTGIKLNPRNVEVQSGSLTSLTLDFDADKSIVKLGSKDKPKKGDYYFILKPVIFILDASSAIRIDTETMAVNFSFPTGLEVVEAPSDGSITQEGNVLVADFAIFPEDNHTVFDVNVSNTTPVDVSDPADTNWQAFASSLDVLGGELLVNYPTGVTQNAGSVWVANAESVVGPESAGNVSEYDTAGTPIQVFIDNTGTTESSEGLVITSGIEFGGFAPNGSLSGGDLLLFQTNGNGSVTGINLGDGRIFDVLGAGSFADPSDAAFVPEPFDGSGGTGTVIGSLFVTDAGADEITMFPLMTTGPVGEYATRIVPGAITTLTYPFVYEPIGIAYSAGSGRLYIANRGNGSIIAIAPDTAEIAAYDTGLGGDSLNGIDAIYSDAIDADILFLTNTASTSDPSSGPAYGMGTLEKAVIALSPAP